MRTGSMVAVMVALSLTSFDRGTSQTVVTLSDTASACTAIPQRGVSTGCKVLTAGTLVTVTGSMADEWVRVVIDGREWVIERGRLRALGAGPCADSMYQAFRKRPMSELTEREYQYMMERDRACTEHQRTVTSIQPQQEALEEGRKMTKNMNNWIVGSVLLSAVVGWLVYR